MAREAATAATAEAVWVVAREVRWAATRVVVAKVAAARVVVARAAAAA